MAKYILQSKIFTNGLTERNFTCSGTYSGYDFYSIFKDLDVYKTHWNSNGASEWIQIELTQAMAIERIVIANIMVSRTPEKIIVKASNDGKVYYEISTLTPNLNVSTDQEFFVNKDKNCYKYWCFYLSGTRDIWLRLNKLSLYTVNYNKYLIKQNSNYYSIKCNFLNLGQPVNNSQLENWYNKYGEDDVNIITQNLNNKEYPMSKNENGIWKTDFQLDMNEITDNIELVDTDEDNKSIKYNCNDYKILDLCDDKFKLTMCKSKQR